MGSRAIGTRTTSSICSGQYVTKIARWLGLDNTGAFQWCHQVSPGMDHLVVYRLVDMHILVRDDTIGLHKYQLFWAAPLLAAQQPLDRRQVEEPVEPDEVILDPMVVLLHSILRILSIEFITCRV